MIVCNDLFDYGYYIYQDNEYFKFSIDSILLAEFVKLKNNQHILDLCSGNIPIPLILTSKNKTINVTAVELQKEIYDLGCKSIYHNNLTNIKLINDDVKNIKLEQKFDIITCNPPYFKISNQALINESPIKAIARHEIKVNLNDIIECAYNHLNEKGLLYLVNRPNRLIDVITALENKKFGIREIVFVQTKNTNKCEFFLIEASKYKKSDPKIQIINITNLKTYKNIFTEVQK